jgi:hypothetical protein
LANIWKEEVVAFSADISLKRLKKTTKNLSAEQAARTRFELATS